MYINMEGLLEKKPISGSIIKRQENIFLEGMKGNYYE